MDNSITNYLNNLYEIYKIEFSDFDLDDFAIRFAPFVHLVNYWSQILALTISKSSDPNLRKKIISNLYEENCKELTHVDTFKLFISECQNNQLSALIELIDEINSKLDINDQIRSTINSNTELFESNPLIAMYKISILNFIETNDFEDCCQMLGAIQYIYSLISADINVYFRLKTGHVIANHYTIDKISEIKYSTNFFDCNSKPINEINLEFGIKWITGSIRSLIMI
jgi:hypothetical protein